MSWRSIKIQGATCIWFFAAYLCMVGDSRAAWDVAVAFLGASEDERYQREIDRNLLELAKLPLRPEFNLTILRDFSDRTLIYEVGRPAHQLSLWDELFFTSPLSQYSVPGKIHVARKNPDPFLRMNNSTWLSDRPAVEDFFAKAFSRPEAKRILILWGHGLAFKGLAELALPNLHSLLASSLPQPRVGAAKPLDILWFNACFMASVEVAYELSALSKYLLASEEAEFAAGAPFDALDLLVEAERSLEDSAIELAREYLNSYSYLQLGSQRSAIDTHSATISVIDLEKISWLAERLKQLREAFGSLLEEERKELAAGREARSMAMVEVSDLGNLLGDLKKLARAKEVAALLHEMQFGLETLRVRRRHTNQSVRLGPAPPQSILVYGYSDWQAGFAGDAATIERLPEELRPTNFAPGPVGKRWPFLNVEEGARLKLVPFLPGRDRFHAYFASATTAEPLTEPRTWQRREDREVFQFRAQNPQNPVVFSGYTQGIGQNASRYLGLSIFDPSAPMSPALLRTRFHALSGWGKF